MDINRFIQYKNILILGFGREGQSTYKFLRSRFPNQKIVIGDKNGENVKEYFAKYPDNFVSFQLDENYLINNNYDLVIKSPGIPYKSIRHAFPPNIITSQAELFLMAFRNRVIGVTGTKGKSTTSTLIYEVLKAYKFPVRLVGNIGIPPLDVFNEDTGKEIYIYEMSSHMLEQINISPHIAVVTNIYQEHLDHYDSYQAYIDSKANIVKHQDKNDIRILCMDNDILMSQFNIFDGREYLYSLNNENANVYSFGKELIIRSLDNSQIEETINLDFNRVLKGEHNLLNIMGVFCLLAALSISDFEKALEVISKFKGLPHRLQFVGKFNSIDFYNDSISTIPETTIAGLMALNKVDILMLGGMDREVEYDKLVDYVLSSDIKLVILMYATGLKLQKLFLEKTKKNDSKIKFLLVDDLKKAVEVAVNFKEINVEEDDLVCLFSPAAASYGYFKDFADRGNHFFEYLEEATFKDN